MRTKLPSARYQGAEWSLSCSRPPNSTAGFVDPCASAGRPTKGFTSAGWHRDPLCATPRRSPPRAGSTRFRRRSLVNRYSRTSNALSVDSTAEEQQRGKKIMTQLTKSMGLAFLGVTEGKITPDHDKKSLGRNSAKNVIKRVRFEVF
jgi:hypothetical protein